MLLFNGFLNLCFPFFFLCSGACPAPCEHAALARGRMEPAGGCYPRAASSLHPPPKAILAQTHFPPSQCLPLGAGGCHGLIFLLPFLSSEIAFAWQPPPLHPRSPLGSAEPAGEGLRSLRSSLTSCCSSTAFPGAHLLLLLPSGPSQCRGPPSVPSSSCAPLHTAVVRAAGAWFS